MKKWVLMLSATGALLSSVAFANEYEPLKKQMNILAEILETSVEQESDNRNMAISRFDYSYLEGQGVVFFADSGHRSWHLVSPEVPEPPIPPRAEEMGEFAERMKLDVIIEKGLRNAHRVLSQMSGEYSDEWFEMTEQARDTAWQLRDKERELRDLEFEQRSADDARKKDIQAEKEELETELSTLREQQKSLQKKAAELKSELEEKRRQFEDKQKETRQSVLKRFESMLAETLCTYGVTLKSLPDDEKVSVVLKDFYPGKSGKSEDQLYVFDKSELIQCVSGGDSASLLESAKRYRF